MIDTEIKVTPQIAAEHGLTPDEYARIQKILGRDPNFTELGIFSVMWSEHCSYKSSRVHLKRLPTHGTHVVQGPGENAGVVDIGDGSCAVFKIESHNHPSFVEPFQGAATGVGGILRDIFTMGARPIAVLDSLRFGPITPGLARETQPPEEIARNRRILDGVIRGIGFYGNCFGVPTVGGEVVFEPCYSNNPLVNALALGIARREDLFFARARGVGNPVIYVGAKTGRDGIHGASLLASAEFSEESQQKRPNVQVGDPFMEKLLLEACLEAMRTGAVVAIQDMGAAGLTSSSSEMASRGGSGNRNRSGARAAARNRHDALRNHAQRIAGAHAAGRRARPRTRSFRRVSQMGTRRGRSRPRHRRWQAARSGSRPRSPRKFPRTQSRKKGRVTSGRLLRLPPPRSQAKSRWLNLRAKARTSPKISAAAGFAHDCVETLDHRTVRFDGAHEYARRPGRGRRRRAAPEGNQARACAFDRRQRPLVLSGPAPGRDARRGGSGAQRGVHGRAARLPPRIA